MPIGLSQLKAEDKRKQTNHFEHRARAHTHTEERNGFFLCQQLHIKSLEIVKHEQVGILVYVCVQFPLYTEDARYTQTLSGSGYTHTHTHSK